MIQQKWMIKSIFTVLLVMAACSNPEKEWEKAKRLNTIEAYQQFIQKYPDNAFANEAMKKVVELDWVTAKKSNNIAAYQFFLKKHPQPDANALYSLPLYFGKGIAMNKVAIRRWSKYDGTSPEGGSFPWFADDMFMIASANPFSSVIMSGTRRVEWDGDNGKKMYEMMVENFESPKSLPGGVEESYFEITLWFINSANEMDMVYLGKEDQSGLDVSLIFPAGDALSARAFRIPGLDIYNKSLVSFWRGKIGTKLPPGRETWLRLVFQTPAQDSVAVLKIKDIPIVVALKK